jgi:hypothetical protein
VISSSAARAAARERRKIAVKAEIFFIIQSVRKTEPYFPESLHGNPF